MHQQLRLTEQERADLVAFLDGELEEEDAQKLEQKVTASVSARKEVEALEKTWNLLDWLPRPELSDDFASQTITRIHSRRLRAERIEGRVKQVSLAAVRAAGWLVGVAAAALLGFAALRFAWPDPTRELIEDLEIVENLQNYQAVPDIGFLQQLSLLRMFGDADPAASDEAASDPAGTGQHSEPGQAAPM